MQSVTTYNNNSFLLTIFLESLIINIGNFPFGGEPFPWSFPIKSITSETSCAVLSGSSGEIGRKKKWSEKRETRRYRRKRKWNVTSGLTDIDVWRYIRRSIFTGFLSSHDSYTATISACPQRQIYSCEGYFLIPQRAPVSPSFCDCRSTGEIAGGCFAEKS